MYIIWQGVNYLWTLRLQLTKDRYSCCKYIKQTLYFKGASIIVVNVECLSRNRSSDRTVLSVWRSRLFGLLRETQWDHTLHLLFEIQTTV